MYAGIVVAVIRDHGIADATGSGGLRIHGFEWRKIMRFHIFPAAALAAAVLTATPVLAEETAHEVAVSLGLAWDEDFNRADAAALAEHYAEDAVLSPGNGEILEGREEIQGLFQSFLDNGVHSHRIEIVRADHTGDLLVQTGHWQAEGTDGDGNAITFGGVLTTSFRRTDAGDWEMVSHVWNMAD